MQSPDQEGDDPALFQIEGKRRTQPDPTIIAANAASRLFLRVERQTLSRLADGGFVLFTIRVHSYSLTRVLAQPGAAARLAAALRALPPSMAAYKKPAAVQGCAAQPPPCGFPSVSMSASGSKNSVQAA